MHYVIGDIHNELKKLNSILKRISLTEGDEVILLGDVFDRGGNGADPVGVYFALTGIPGKCSWIRGNHDQWLADYIHKYYSLPERKRKKMMPYAYNTFELMKNRLTQADMLQLADIIDSLPLQKGLELDGTRYLFAHAMTSPEEEQQNSDYYLMGTYDIERFFTEGIDGVISMCGHTPTDDIFCSCKRKLYLDSAGNSIWRNEKKNVYLLDCGSGFSGGRLACICLETGERFYS